MQDDIAFAPPAETLTTDGRLTELATTLPVPSRAPTHRKRMKILRWTETVRWTFSPSDAVVGDRCKTELETTHEEKHKEIKREGRACAPR